MTIATNTTMLYRRSITWFLLLVLVCYWIQEIQSLNVVIPGRRSHSPFRDMASITSRRFLKIPFTGSDSSNSNNNNNNNNKDEIESSKMSKIGLSGLLQLITAGMGSPFLGDFEGVDKETGKLMFSLEANNLVDEKGESKQVKMPYFEQGWVSEEDLQKEKQRKDNKNKRSWFNIF